MSLNSFGEYPVFLLNIRKGQKAAENFTGDTWVEILTTDGANFDAMSYNVTFAPGSRTY